VTILPGEVHLADLFEGGMRPIIIISREQLNRGTLYLGVPVTGSRVEERRRYANYVFLSAGTGGLRADSVAVTHLVQRATRCTSPATGRGPATGDGSWQGGGSGRR
jgi:mRNA-degrading endonuclease toxin of MazEF toxin-antitoxin module